MVVEAIARQLVFIDQVDSYIMAQDSILTGPGNRAPRPTPERHQSRSPGATHCRPHPASERNDMNIVGALESPDLLL